MGLTSRRHRVYIGEYGASKLDGPLCLPRWKLPLVDGGWDWSTLLAKHDLQTLMRRLNRAGFKREFLRQAILPNWWEPSCEADSGLLQDVELRAARFLGVPLADVRNPRVALAAPRYPAAQLRRVRNVDRDRMGPAIHTAVCIASAVVRCMRNPVQYSAAIPADGFAWRQIIERSGNRVTLDDMLLDLWTRGIPVIPIDALPSPSFQGAAALVDERPVIVLGHRHDQPGRVAFFVAHEAGHIASGDCAPDSPVVDEEEEISDDADIERKADEFAKKVLVGNAVIPSIAGSNYKSLAKQAHELEASAGADASAVIFSWARQTGDYSTATLAVRALYRDTGAWRQLRALFDQFVDVEGGSESDRDLLRCVYGDSERDDAPR